MDTKAIAERVARSVTAGTSLPQGYFEPTKTFTIGFGSWRIKFRKGLVIRSDRSGVSSWSPKRGDWVERKPPIQGVRKLDLSEYGSRYEQEEQASKFLSNTRVVSEQEAKRLTLDSEQRLVLKVKEFSKVVENLGLRPNDKVVVIVPPQR